MAEDTILVVDDVSSNLIMAQRILEKKYHIAAAKSGAVAFRYLEKNRPALILMDIKMPGMNGFEAVNRLKQDERYRSIPVIFLTGETNPETEKKCFEAGAVDFVGKPFVPDILLSRVERTLELEHYRKNLEHIVEKQTRELAERAERIGRMQEAVIQGMANLIENRDGNTGKHVKNTQTYVQMIVDRLCEKGCFAGELDKESSENIVKAAPLHDIGKIRIPDSILLKPARLTEEEYDAMKKHTEYGSEIIHDIIRDVEDERYTRTAADIALYHHEWWDGRGYPHGLRGDEIPLCARIMAVADVFDALYEERCYKKPIRPVDKVLEIMKRGRGTQFDAVILDAFVELEPELRAYLGE